MMNELIDSIVSSSYYYYEIIISLFVVFASFVFLAPILELQEWTSGALATSTRIETGELIQIRMWSMDGPICLDIFRRPFARMIARLLCFCNRCRSRRERLGNAFGKKSLRLYEKDRVSNLFECVRAQNNDHNDNNNDDDGNFTIFICPKDIRHFKKIPERVRLECRVVKGSSVYGRVRLEIESPVLRTNRNSYSFLEPILIDVRVNLAISDMRDDLQIVLCPEKELRNNFSENLDDLARAHEKPIRCKEDESNDCCEMTYVVKDQTLSSLKTDRYVAVLISKRNIKRAYCLSVSNVFDISAPSLEIVTTDSKSSATLQALRWHEPFAVRVSCPGFHQSMKKDYIAICPRGHQGLPCIPSSRSFLKRGLEFVGLSGENISNSNFVQDVDDDDNQKTTRLVQFRTPWLLPGVYHAVYCVWIPSEKKYHSSVWRSAPFQIMGPNLDLMISSEINRVATLRGKLRCSDPVVANVSSVSGRMHSGHDSVALCYLPLVNRRDNVDQKHPSAPSQKVEPVVVVSEEKEEEKEKDLNSKALRRGEDLEIVHEVKLYKKYMSKSDDVVIRTSSSKSSLPLIESEFTLRTEIMFENKTLRPGEYFFAYLTRSAFDFARGRVVSVDKPVLIGQSANFRVHAPYLCLSTRSSAEEEEKEEEKITKIFSRENVCVHFEASVHRSKKDRIKLLCIDTNCDVASLPIEPYGKNRGHILFSGRDVPTLPGQYCFRYVNHTEEMLAQSSSFRILPVWLRCITQKHYWGEALRVVYWRGKLSSETNAKYDKIILRRCHEQKKETEEVSSSYVPLNPSVSDGTLTFRNGAPMPGKYDFVYTVRLCSDKNKISHIVGTSEPFEICGPSLFVSPRQNVSWWSTPLSVRVSTSRMNGGTDYVMLRGVNNDFESKMYVPASRSTSNIVFDRASVPQCPGTYEFVYFLHRKGWIKSSDPVQLCVSSSIKIQDPTLRVKKLKWKSRKKTSADSSSSSSSSWSSLFGMVGNVPSSTSKTRRLIVLEFETSPNHQSTDTIAMYRESAPDFSPIISKSVVTTGGQRSIVFELDELPDGTDQKYEFRYLIGRLSVAVAKQVLVISKDAQATIEARQSEKSVKSEMIRSVVAVSPEVVSVSPSSSSSTLKDKDDRITYPTLRPLPKLTSKEVREEEKRMREEREERRMREERRCREEDEVRRRREEDEEMSVEKKTIQAPTSTPVPTPALSIAKKYKQMLKVGIPLSAVLAKVRNEIKDQNQVNDIIKALDSSSTSSSASPASNSTTKKNTPSAVELAYARKIKLGIPKLAIRREMESKGIDPSIVDRVCGSSSSKNAKKKRSGNTKEQDDDDVLKQLLDKNSVFSGMFQQQTQEQQQKPQEHKEDDRKKTKKKRTQASIIVLDSSRHMAVNMTSGVLFTGCSGSQKKKLERVRKLCSKLSATSPKFGQNNEGGGDNIIKKSSSLNSREIERLAQTFEAANLSAKECKQLSKLFQDTPQRLVQAEALLGGLLSHVSSASLRLEALRIVSQYDEDSKQVNAEFKEWQECCEIVQNCDALRSVQKNTTQFVAHMCSTRKDVKQYEKRAFMKRLQSPLEVLKMSYEEIPRSLRKGVMESVRVNRDDAFRSILDVVMYMEISGTLKDEGLKGPFEKLAKLDMKCVARDGIDQLRRNAQRLVSACNRLGVICKTLSQDDDSTFTSELSEFIKSRESATSLSPKKKKIEDIENSCRILRERFQMSRSDLTQTMFSILSALSRHAISSRERALGLRKEEERRRDLVVEDDDDDAKKKTQKTPDTKGMLLAAMAKRRGNMNSSSDWDDDD